LVVQTADVGWQRVGWRESAALAKWHAMRAEKGDLAINRAPAGVAFLAVGCRHVGYDWSGVGLEWVEGLRLWVTATVEFTEPERSFGPSVNVDAIPESRSHWPK
jgi:hypothetical protein